MVLQWFSCGFPIDSCGFPLVFLWSCSGFTMVFQLFYNVFLYFPISASDFPYLFLWCCSGFPLVFLWFLYGFTMVFLWFSCSFLYNLTRFSNMEVWPVGSETAFVGTKAARASCNMELVWFRLATGQNMGSSKNALVVKTKRKKIE